MTHICVKGRLPTIKEYVLVASQTLKIEIYHKEQHKWIYDAFEKNEEIILNSLGMHFSLTDAYIDIEFEAALEDFPAQNERRPE